MISFSTILPFLALVLVLSMTTHGFVIVHNSPNNAVCSIQSLSSSTTRSATTSQLFGGGFGGGGGGDDKGNKTKKEIKLKPKQQWDRYLSFKTEPKIRVAVRVVEDESQEWLEVGRVKAQNPDYTELAVARQRAIIAEVRTNEDVFWWTNEK